MAWTTRAEAVQEAARDPRIAAVLAVSDATCAAIVERDAETFAAGHTPDFVVNSPANRVLTGSQPQQGFAAGFIDYHSLDREIDYAAVLPEGLVVIMGEETAKPRGAAHMAGKTVRRRFTDLWRNVDGHWQVAVRQATVIQVE
jgi:ketosteroid isomerase-like protein